MEIKELKIVSNHIIEQESFYKNVLGFPCKNLSNSELEIEAGSTKLILQSSDKPVFYHFAFLIPSGSLESAIEFLENRSIELLALKGNKIIHFNSDRAIYFYDKDGNIVEFIERPSLNYPKSQEFSIDQIITINEIGLPVQHPREMGNRLKSEFGIIPIEGAPFREDFCWLGDHNGAIIVVKKGRKWLPTEKASVLNDFTITYSDQAKTYHLSFSNNEIV